MFLTGHKDLEADLPPSVRIPRLPESPFLGRSRSLRTFSNLASRQPRSRLQLPHFNLSVSCVVLKNFWYCASRDDHGCVEVNHSFSRRRASKYVIPFLTSCEEGCFTQYQLLTRGSVSLRRILTHAGSSPGGIRSGFVRTPVKIVGWLRGLK